jgi:hypothetical protein
MLGAMSTWSGPPLPTGTLTFHFTDVEGSTRLWEQPPHAMTPCSPPSPSGTKA